MISFYIDGTFEKLLHLVGVQGIPAFMHTYMKIPDAIEITCEELAVATFIDKPGGAFQSVSCLLVVASTSCKQDAVTCKEPTFSTP